MLATDNGTTQRIAQDYAAPLRQMLETTTAGVTTAYLYGTDRLGSVQGIHRIH